MDELRERTHMTDLSTMLSNRTFNLHALHSLECIRDVFFQKRAKSHPSFSIEVFPDGTPDAALARHLVTQLPFELPAIEIFVQNDI